MSQIVFQPKGTGTPHKEGTIITKAPKGARSAPANSGWGGEYYTIDDYVSNLPTTGTINENYSGRFDDPRYYTGDTAS